MQKRGKVLRDPLTGPGLLIAEGRQYPFVIDDSWKSDVPPKPGLLVDIEFDPEGKIAGITAVPHLQLAREQAELSEIAKQGRKSPLASILVAQFGVAELIATSLLMLSWFFLTAVSVELPLTGTSDLTFWQLLGYLGSGNLLQGLRTQISTGPGAYGLLAVIAILGPLVHHFWKGRRARLAGLLPLSLMLLVGVLLHSRIDSLLANGVGRLYGQSPEQARGELMSAIALGPGTYVSLVISIYFAFSSARQFLRSKASENTGTPESQSAAA